jgi:hypothetical protein
MGPPARWHSSRRGLAWRRSASRCGRIPAKDVIFRDLTSEDRAWVPVGAAWKPDGVTAAAASQFVDVLAQTCAMENGESRAPEIELKQLGSRQK